MVTRAHDRATELLEQATRAAAAAFPSVKLAPELFVEHVRARLDGTTIDKLHLEDLYLACACLHRDKAAWRALDKIHLSRVRDFVARIDGSPAFADEVRQRLSEKLLHDEGGAGKLALYTGRGPLGGWIRVAAVREAQNTRRGVKHAVDASDIALAAREDDAEVQLLKRKYAKEFKDAFATVLATIPQDQRNVLRLHYLDGLTIEEVGKAYKVSRATAARWIADAKAKIVEEVEVALRKRVGKGANADSLLALVRSQLDLSLRKHFD